MPDPSPPPSPEPTHGHPPPWWRTGRFYRRLSIAGVAVSLAVHVVLWLIAAVVHVGFSNADAGGHAGSPVEFAVVTSLELAEPAATTPTATPAVEDASAVETSLVDALAQLSVSEEATDSPDPTQLRVELGAGDVASSTGLSIGAVSARSAGSGSGASFFGLEAQGRRFVYVIDVSLSMAGGKIALPGRPRRADAETYSRFEVMKIELMNSIDGLLESSEFSVFLFADGTGRLYPRSWIPATERNRIAARSRIAQMAADDVARFGVRGQGRTDPRDAFAAAMRLRPVPDAVYLMTDGSFTERDVPESFAAHNSRSRVPVHCILFMEPDAPARPEAEAALQRIASESGGSYAFVSGGGP